MISRAGGRLRDDPVYENITHSFFADTMRRAGAFARDVRDLSPRESPFSVYYFLRSRRDTPRRDGRSPAGCGRPAGVHGTDDREPRSVKTRLLLLDGCARIRHRDLSRTRGARSENEPRALNAQPVENIKQPRVAAVAAAVAVNGAATVIATFLLSHRYDLFGTVL